MPRPPSKPPVFTSLLVVVVEDVEVDVDVLLGAFGLDPNWAFAASGRQHRIVPNIVDFNMIEPISLELCHQVLARVRCQAVLNQSIMLRPKTCGECGWPYALTRTKSE